MPYKDHEKQKDFQKKWIKDRRKDYFKGKKCASCGKALTASNAELDHKKPIGNKGSNEHDHKVWSLSKENRNKRIKAHGMRGLCKACHKKKTKKDMAKMAEDISSITLVPLDEIIKEITKNLKKDKKK